MAETIYPGGIRCFKKKETAPDFVLGSVVITLSDFKDWINEEGAEYLTEYQGKKQLKLQAKTGKNGLYLSVDTYKPKKEETDF